MKEESKIINIQNAVIVNEEILCSISKYKEEESDGFNIWGGLIEFAARDKTPKNNKDIIPLYLTTKDSIDKIMNTLLWGTMENNKFTYKFMKDLTEEHLTNIINSTNKETEKKVSVSPIHTYIAKMLLKRIWINKK
jgi:hypothetical protein